MVPDITQNNSLSHVKDDIAITIKKNAKMDCIVWNRVWFSRELRECMTFFSFHFQMNKKERE